MMFCFLWWNLARLECYRLKKKKIQNIFAPGFSKNSKFFIVQTSIKDHTFLIQNVRQLHPNKLEI